MALTYYRPLAKRDWLHQFYGPYARLLYRNFNGGKRIQGVLAWLLGVLIPVLIIGSIYLTLMSINSVIGILFGVLVLYLTLRFSNFGHRAEQIAASLKDHNIDYARSMLAEWDGAETSHYNATQVASTSIETILARAHHGLFAPILWFVLLGPAGALLYRLSHLIKLEWSRHPQPSSVDIKHQNLNYADSNPEDFSSAFASNHHFGDFAHQAFAWLDWLPTRVTAGGFAIVGDFEDAAYCWRTQSSAWQDKSLGIILASGAGALGVKLGEPLPYRGVLHFRPELGLGDEADADYLKSAVGLVWRVLILMVGLVLLLTFAHWLGN